MSRSKTESTQIFFACSLAGKDVSIYRDYKVLIGSSGEEVARAISRTDCSNKDNCAVATHLANSTQYDWAKCIFVKATQSQA